MDERRRFVSLEHPIEAPGGVISTVSVRPITLAEARAFPKTDELEYVIAEIAAMTGLPIESVLDLDPDDANRITAAYRDLVGDLMAAGEGFAPLVHSIESDN